MAPTTHVAPFVCRPLRHPREIRVIRLAAHPDVVLSLEHRNLDDKPLYIAVSYRWGTEAAEDDLIVEGRALRVRKGLKSMIEALKDERSVRLLWIDAICIHQNSTDEQNHQVQLMGEIYSRADHVVAYLEGARQSTLRVHGQSVYSKLAECAHRLGISPKPLSQHSRDRLRPEPFLPVLSDEYFSRRWSSVSLALLNSISEEAGLRWKSFRDFYSKTDKLRLVVAQRLSASYATRSRMARQPLSSCFTILKTLPVPSIRTLSTP
jgi:Heterokaryon incompatibility protein (HET)